MSHGIMICPKCRKRTGGCRCMEHNKTYEGPICDDCKRIAPAIPQDAGGLDLAALDWVIKLAENGSGLMAEDDGMISRAKAQVRRLRAAPAPVDLREALAAIDKAEVEVAHICRERWEGREGWRTSIPARPDYDSDLIISDALRKAGAALAAPVEPKAEPVGEITALRARVAELEKGIQSAHYTLEVLVPILSEGRE